MRDGPYGPFTFGQDIWPGLAKLQEEMNELDTVLAKIQGLGGGTDYWGGRDLRPELLNEIADVRAALDFFLENSNFSGEEILNVFIRSDTKQKLFDKWHKGENNA